MHKGCQSDLKEKEQKEEKEGNKEEVKEKKKEKEEKKRKKEQEEEEEERKDLLRHFNKHCRGLAEDCTPMSGHLLCSRRCCR